MLLEYDEGPEEDRSLITVLTWDGPVHLEVLAGNLEIIILTFRFINIFVWAQYPVF